MALRPPAGEVDLYEGYDYLSTTSICGWNKRLILLIGAEQSWQTNTGWGPDIKSHDKFCMRRSPGWPS